jgi:hypothetical protein
MSLRYAAKSLRNVIVRSYTSIWRWVQRLGPVLGSFGTDPREVRRIFVDETIVEAEGPTIIERALGGSRAAVAIQLAASVPLLLAGSYVMVGSAADMSRALGIPAISLSIIVIPLATALPETLSSLIWAFRGRDTLAVGALIGESVMFSTVYPALGILLTGWRLNSAAYAIDTPMNSVSSGMSTVPPPSPVREPMKPAINPKARISRIITSSVIGTNGCTVHIPARYKNFRVMLHASRASCPSPGRLPAGGLGSAR